MGNEKQREGQNPDQVVIDQHFTPQFYAELWGVSTSTIIRWFEDVPGVLKLGEPNRRGRRRVELRIPYSLALRVYTDRSK
jgi:hypothetical protein